MKQLIPDVPEEDFQKVLNLDIDLIIPNPNQPRKHFDTEKLQELAASITENGVIQPVVVMKSGKDYQLIAGERRWRASQLAGYEKIPAIVKNATEDQALSWALIENIQRQDLNPIEEALAYKNLMEQQGITQEVMAKKLGKGRVTITNTMRLLKLPQQVQTMLSKRELSFGHARSLVGLDEEDLVVILASEAVKKGWSVRVLEEKVQNLKKKDPDTPKKPKKDPFIKNAEKKMAQFIGTKVIIMGNQKKGKVTIPYVTEDELQRIYECLTGMEEENDY
jgi:ParB family chromosome partitioning protein